MIRRPPRFSAWPIVRSRLVPLMLVLDFANLVALALHQHEVSVALSVLQFVVPVVAGYEARRYGGTYGNALRTAWLTAAVSTFVVGIPLTAVGFLTGALPVQVPPGVQIDATAIVVAVLVLALLLPIVAVVIWIAWIPFTLIGAWIAPEPAALPTETHSPDAAGSAPAIVQFLDWMAVLIVAFGGTLYVLFKLALDPNAVFFLGRRQWPATYQRGCFPGRAGGHWISLLAMRRLSGDSSRHQGGAVGARPPNRLVTWTSQLESGCCHVNRRDVRGRTIGEWTRSAPPEQRPVALQDYRSRTSFRASIAKWEMWKLSKPTTSSKCDRRFRLVRHP